jgi:hypothetical protein
MTTHRLPRVLAAVAVCAGLLAVPAVAEAPTGADSLASEAQQLEDSVPDHLYYGQVFTARYATPDHVPGQVVGLETYSDAGLWSGVYLAGEAYRYAVLKNEAELATTDRARRDAGAALPDVLARIHLLLDADTLRVGIAGSWTAANPEAPTGRGYGPGAVNAEPGLLFRNCFPAGVPSWQENQDPATRDDHVFGPLLWAGKHLAWEPLGQHLSYDCEDSISRDEYIGTVYGLLAAFDVVGPDDPSLQAEARDDVLTMVGYLERHGWCIVYPWTRSESGNPAGDPSVVPLFTQTPQAQLRMTQAAWHVAQVAGTPEQKATWQALWDQGLATMGPNYLNDQLLAIQNPSNAYYGFNLNYLNTYDLVRLADDPASEALFRQGLAIVDATAGDDLNAHFEAITYSLTGDPAKRDAAWTHLRDWMAYHDATSPVTNSTRCGHDLECVPDDQVTFVQDTPAGEQRVVQPGQSTTERDAAPLPIAQRPPQDFLWQRSPFTLDGSQDPVVSQPGVDFLSPYWMLRYWTEVRQPARRPLPAWPGPRTT